jgi:hypothetical protein
MKEVTSRGAERPSTNHSEEVTRVKRMLVNSGFDLQK